MNSLFSKPSQVATGDEYVNIALEVDGTPHPLRYVRVTSVDETGMIYLHGVKTDEGGEMMRIVSHNTLQKEYRKLKE